MSLDLHLLTNLVTLKCSNAGLAGTLDVNGISTLTTLDCSTNATLTTLTLTGCTSLTNLQVQDCTILTVIQGDSTCTSLDTVDLNNSGVLAITLGGAANMVRFGGSNSGLTSVIANALQTVSADLVFDASPITTFTVPSLVSVGQQFALTTTLIGPAVSFPALVSVGIVGPNNLDFHTNTSMVSLSAPNLVTVGDGVNLANCTSLVTVGLSSYVPTVGTNVTFFNCALDTTSIDMILARCVASAGWGFTGEYVDLSGGTNLSHSLWSAAALADEAILVGRGGPPTVLSNP